MASDVDIANLALTHVGVSEYLESLDDDTLAGRVAKANYGLLRDRVLEAVWWPFATKHATLALLAGVTRSGWGHAYSLPDDCLAPRYIFSGVRRGAPLATMSAVVDPVLLNASPLPLSGVGQQVPFAVEANDALDARLLLTDATTPELVYTAKLTNAGLFSPGFVDALGYLLGERLARAVVKKPALADDLEKHYQAEIAKAWGSVFRAEQDDVQPDSEFISVRG